MINGYQSNPSIFLLPNEKIVFKTNPHWLFLAMPVIAIILFWLFYMLFACPFLEAIDFNGIESFCYIIAAFAFSFVILILYLDWRFNRLYLTNKRLIKERGIIGKRFMSIRLDNIEDITCSFGIWGRIFGYGNLIIESAGTYGKMVFEGMQKPRRIKLRIENEMGQIISSTA
ncbi:MAG: PH domain-containing protein [Candidatus Aminicenantes bacterium]|nr:PH domain-containing protein [Candidatus Aminicenantes bacterium]